MLVVVIKIPRGHVRTIPVPWRCIVNRGQGAVGRPANVGVQPVVPSL